MAARLKIVFNPFTGNFDLVTRPGSGRRIGEDLSAQVDGATDTFVTPTKFIHQAPGDSISVYLNGVRLRLGAANDYTLSESGGSGTGFDTITLAFIPRAGASKPDILLVDYTER